MIYDEFKDEVIQDFEARRDELILKDNLTEPRQEMLFGIQTNEEKLYQKIIRCIETTAVWDSEKLLMRLFTQYGITTVAKPTKVNTSSNSYMRPDIEIIVNNKKYFIEIKASINNRAKTLITMGQQINEPGYFVFLLNDSLASRKSIEQFSDELSNAGVNNFKVYLFEDFLGAMFGEEEKNLFSYSMKDFKKDMHEEIGYKLTELCNDYNWEEFKVELNKEFLSLNYDDLRNKQDARLNPTNDPHKKINDDSFEKIKEAFLEQGRYKVLLGEQDFANSFRSSEWVYKTQAASSRLDNTCIVAGYLKSIEQLLSDIIVLIGQGKYLDGMLINKDSREDSIETTLGSLEIFLNKNINIDLFSDAFKTLGEKKKVKSYLNEQLDDWRDKQRNGYFHKNNLMDVEKVDTIRYETYFLYLLILGSLKMGSEVLDELMYSSNDSE